MVRSVLAALVVALITAGQAPAADLVAITDDWAPFEYTEDGRLKGLSVDLAREMLARAGLTADFETGAWARVEAMVKERPDALGFTFARTPEREGRYQWIGPIYPRQITFFRLASRPDITAGGVEDLKRFSIASVEGFAFTKWLRANGFDKIVLTTNATVGIERFFAGQVDMVGYVPPQIYYSTRQLGHSADELAPVHSLPKQGDYYFVMNPSAPAGTVGALRRAFRSMVDDGTLACVVDSYLDGPECDRLD